MTKAVFIIAEAGVNHNGSLEVAKQLVDAAVDAGANAVKFQTFKADALVTQDAQQADYQTENTGVKESQYAMLKRLELAESDHLELVAYCQKKQIEFMSTAFDDESIELLHRLGMQRWKIPSGELLSIPYLRQIAKFNQQTILSTGMGNLEEVALAIQTLLSAGLSKQNLTILHANTAYPTPYADVNLRAMQTLSDEFKVSTGLSDHSLGIEVPIAAVALGAVVIEKHFTLDKTLPGPD
ncbi:MAG: N-acetylneuraminate synthase family protein, partial [Pseudomonadota bacterium]|nr:N-acetylneuraminate synthase family protein [Pseudomonadota bacterium]